MEASPTLPQPANNADGFAAAQRAHQGGRLDEARMWYQQVISLDRTHFRAHGLLGALYLQLGQPQAAIASLQASLAINSNQPSTLLNLGIALQGIGQSAQAGAAFSQAVRLRPNYTAAWLNLGAVQQAQGELPSAITSYDRVIASDPNCVEAHYNRAVGLLSLGHAELALQGFDRVLQLHPNTLDGLHNRALALRQLKRREEALAACDRAIAIAPQHPRAYYYRGIVLRELKRRDEALAAIEMALELNPQAFEYHLEHGIALQALNQYERAIAALDVAIALRPAEAAAHYQRGLALQHLGRRADAEVSFDQALALAPEDPHARWNKALLLLQTGRLAEAWPLYESRWQREEMQHQVRHFEAPAWRGQTDIAGRTILLYAEQGLGDTIQFSRYAPLLVEHGAQVVLEVPGMLTGLLSSLHRDITVIAQGDAIPDIDYHCALMSLPLACGTTLETIPAYAAYLSADSDRTALWAARLGPKQPLRVGFVWSGNPHLPNDHNRSIPLGILSPLLSLDAECHSLQKEYRTDDESAMTMLPPVHCWQDHLHDFADTAALVANMDLVISVDTSIAHLAAALGKPTWLLLPKSPDYRWLIDRDDTPWYPSMTLYRQRDFGDWVEVIARVKADLLARSASAKGRNDLD